MRTSIKNDVDNLARSVGEIIRSRNRLVRRALNQYTVEAENIFRTQNCDTNRIEHLLDYMLDFCFDPDVLGLYKKVCRYYYSIDPAAVVSYVHAYRDMWDEGSSKKKKTARKL